MIKYEFYYQDVLLGYLEICDGQHRFLPVEEAVAKISREVPLIPEVQHGRDWGKPIPFFKERIENATRFGMEKCIRYHTDLFMMRMVLE